MAQGKQGVALPLWCMEGREERSWTAVEGERENEVEGLCCRRCIVLMDITEHKEES